MRRALTLIGCCALAACATTRTAPPPSIKWDQRVGELKTFAKFPSIHLSLPQARLSDAGMKGLSAFPNLTGIDLGGMPVTDAQRQGLEALQGKIVSHIKVKALNMAQVDFVDLLRRITQTIQKPLQDAPAPGSTPASPLRL